ncbi:recombination regulator RecX [Castellaniella sp.]|uniref:recombination regulator RecX n=1 Tax=Castellaniella sp. TaxID=1955812 RepID=UPI003A8EAC2A
MPIKASRPALSLKARAIGYLSRREHSRLELQRKLSAYSDDPTEIQAVLDELEHQHWQSDARYARAYAHRTAARQGARRIMGALRQQGLSDTQLADIQENLQATEPQRAQEVWQRKFGALPADARDYARQYRFLAGRGFSSGVISRLLSGRGIDDDFTGHSGSRPDDDILDEPGDY